MISALETCHAKAALHQGNGEDFGIGERGVSIGRAPPVTPDRVFTQEVMYGDIDNGHLVGDALHPLPRQCRLGDDGFRRDSGGE